MWPIALKSLYTVLLFGLGGILLREAFLVWFDDRIYVGNFNIITEQEETLDLPAFAQQIVSAQAIMSQQLADYQRTGDGESISDATFNVAAEQDRLSLPKEVCKGIDITIQNINFTQIFSAPRKGFTAPNELAGHVSHTDGAVLATVEWPRAPRPVTGLGERSTTFYVPAQPTLLTSARHIACALSYARGAAEQESLARIPRDQFCDFGMALSDLYDLKEKSMTPGGISEAEVTRVRRRADLLASHYGAPEFLPEIYRLRADLIDLLPDKHRSLSDLVQAQEDRLSYAMLKSRHRRVTA